jgi:hypothetical protein
LLYSFNLDDHVPASHLLRGINELLDLSDLHGYLAPFYSDAGRPSMDPELMIRMLIVGYCFDIRSERRLFEEGHLNLAYRWFCRLGPIHHAPGRDPGRSCRQDQLEVSSPGEANFSRAYLELTFWSRRKRAEDLFPQPRRTKKSL